MIFSKLAGQKLLVSEPSPLLFIILLYLYLTLTFGKLIRSCSVSFKSYINVLMIKVVKHIEMPKAAPPKVHLSFSKTRDDIEMK